MMGLELTEKGFIKVDSYYESSQSGVYAIGDLIPGYMLAHVASSEGIKAVRAICRQAEEPVDNSSVPRSLFTTPEIASFGLSEEEAVQQGYDISVGQLPYVYNGRAIASNSAKGFVKIVSEKRYHLLLGAVIVGPHATDILQSLIVLKDAEGTLDQLDKTIFAHPTISELVQEVARLIFKVLSLMDRFSTAILIFQIYISVNNICFYKALYRRRKQYDTLSRIAMFNERKHQDKP